MRLSGLEKNGRQRLISYLAYASISTFARRRRSLQTRRRTRAASLGGVHEIRGVYCGKRRCASVFRKRNQGWVYFYSTGRNAMVLTVTIARKRPPHVHSCVGSGRRSPFSCAWGKHAAIFAQRGWRRRQGKPSRWESTRGFRAATGDDTQLCTWEGRGYASRTTGIEHGSCTIGAEQTTATRTDQRRPATWIRPPFRKRS